jgi:hypothetical protein
MFQALPLLTVPYLLSPACCWLLLICYLLPVADCSLSAISCLLLTVPYLLSPAYCWLFLIRYLLPVADCSLLLSPACCWLFLICSLLPVADCSLSAISCLLLTVPYLLSPACCDRPLLRRDRSSPAQTLGLWVRIPVLAMYVCVCLFCVCVVLTKGWSPAQGVLPTVYWIKKLKQWPRLNGTSHSCFIDV